MLLNESCPANTTRALRDSFASRRGWRDKIHKEHEELSKLLRTLQHVAEGLAKAHDAGIVHRDLKPDNIMITWLEKGYEERDFRMRLINAAFEFDKLRLDPRFRELVRRMGLPE